MEGEEYFSLDARKNEERGAISVSVYFAMAWNVTESANAVHDPTFSKLRCSRYLNSFTPLHGISLSGFKKWRKGGLATEMAIFLWLLNLDLIKRFPFCLQALQFRTYLLEALFPRFQFIFAFPKACSFVTSSAEHSLFIHNVLYFPLSTNLWTLINVVSISFSISIFF